MMVRKQVFFILLLFCLTASLSWSEQIRLGAGVTGGLELPIAQFDQSKGSTFEVKARVGIFPGVIFEPNLTFSKYGDPPTHEEFVPDIDGNKITSYGLDAVLGGSWGSYGVHPYFVFGAGFYNTTQDQIGLDNTDFGWSAGVGIELGVSPQLSLDVRGKAVVIPTDGGGSKKSGMITGGINVVIK